MSHPASDLSLRSRHLELQIWLSPAFPVGSFAYSHGLEWAVGAGRIRDRRSAECWLADLLDSGAPRNDAILLGEAWRLVTGNRDEELAAVNELALAMAGSKERCLETAQQGNAFLSVIDGAWSSERQRSIKPRLRADVAYPVAVGACAAARGMALDVVGSCFLVACVQNLVSALVRLSLIGQTDGQRIIASLMPRIEDAATRSSNASLDEIGSAAFVSDIAAMAHETQNARLFRS